MVVLATAINIGSPAIDRPTTFSSDYTVINMNSPADGSGKITEVSIYPSSTVYGLKIAIFYRPDPSGFPQNWTARDTTTTFGAQSSGLKQLEVDLDVEEGDYIGAFWSDGSIERTTGGSDGYQYVSDDQTACEDLYFSYQSFTNTISLGGTGVVEEEEEVNAIFFGTNF